MTIPSLHGFTFHFYYISMNGKNNLKMFDTLCQLRALKINKKKKNLNLKKLLIRSLFFLFYVTHSTHSHSACIHKNSLILLLTFIFENSFWTLINYQRSARQRHFRNQNRYFDSELSRLSSKGFLRLLSPTDWSLLILSCAAISFDDSGTILLPKAASQHFLIIYSSLYEQGLIYNIYQMHGIRDFVLKI